MRKSFVGLVCVLLLAGCAAKEEPEVIPAPADLHSIQAYTDWNSIHIDAFTPVCAFEQDGDCLHIFPYNNSTRHITIEKYLYSENRLFEQLTKARSDTNKVETQQYSLFTNSDGMTYAFVPVSENFGWLVSSDLPSSYCIKVVEQLCKQGS